jgi:xylono-1,5-lactonase
VPSARWETVHEGFGRLEGPCFDSVGNFYFSDMRPPGEVYRLDPAGRVTLLVSREHVGGLVPHISGGLVATGHTVAVVQQDGEESIVLEPLGGWGFNDLTTDSAGNVFVGMHGERPTTEPPKISASLWRIEPGGHYSRCYDGIGMTNGLRVSPEGDRLYHNDTVAKVVWVSDINEEGMPINRRLHHELQHGVPDGMAIDEAGCIWVAAITSGKLVRIAPNGNEDSTLDTPSNWVASACFGGADGLDLYVVTFGGEPYDPERTGGVYRTRVDVAGAPLSPARI